MRQGAFLLILAVLTAGCSVGKNKGSVAVDAILFNNNTIVANAAVSATGTSIFETSRATYKVQTSSLTAFTAYDSSTGYYTVRVYSNGSVQARFEDSAGTALALMGTTSTPAVNAALLSSWKATRVASSSTGQNVAMALASTSTTNLNAITDLTGVTFSGTVRTGATLSGAKIDTTGNIATTASITYLPKQGTVSGSDFSITFASTPLAGYATGTVTHGSNRVNVTVIPTATVASPFAYSFSLSNLAAPQPGPLAALGYGNE